jgi:hypothetical protein
VKTQDSTSLNTNGEQEVAQPELSNEDFGKSKTVVVESEYIESKIVDVMSNAFKIDYLRLENGQIWREIENDKVRFKIGRTVRIEKGVLGSYNLRMEGVKRMVKVRRVD